MMAGTARDRAQGAMLGLAMGDSLGLASDFHRSIRDTWVRGMLWSGSADLDAQKVSRPLLPFSHGADGTIRATDDLETAVLAGRALLEAADHGTEALFEAWKGYMLADDVWSGVAERSAIVNAGRGYAPPITGADNPAFYTDSAVPAGVAIGIHYAGKPEDAAAVASDYASITHAEDGIWATAAMATAIAALVGGAELTDAIELAESTIPVDSWLGSNILRAREIAIAADSAFSAVPVLADELNTRGYSHGGVAPETLPLAFAVLRLSRGGLTEALPVSLAFGRKSDSLPAMVGALAGAREGFAALAPVWSERLDSVGGVLIPALAGQSLAELVDQLVRE